MISVGKIHASIPSIVCPNFGPLNHELEHFSHCDTTLLFSRNFGVIPIYKILARKYKHELSKEV